MLFEPCGSAPSDKPALVASWSCEFTLVAEERRCLEHWAEETWRLAGAGGCADYFERDDVPHWVWVLIRRADEVRLLDCGGFTSENLPRELAELLDWLRVRVDDVAK